MSEAKWPSRPWIAGLLGGSGDNESWYVRSSEVEPLDVMMVGPDVAICGTEDIANLIAAAPDMAEALEALTHGLPELLESIGYQDEENLIGEALEVLSRARGESE